jgi:hypothetical protein
MPVIVTVTVTVGGPAERAEAGEARVADLRKEAERPRGQADADLAAGPPRAEEEVPRGRAAVLSKATTFSRVEAEHVGWPCRLGMRWMADHSGFCGRPAEA